MTDEKVLRKEIAELRAALAELSGRASEVPSSASGLAHGPRMIELAQNELSRSERVMRHVFNATADGMVLFDDAGRFVDVNVAACSLYGMKKSRLLRAGAFAIATDEASWREFLEVGVRQGELLLQPATGGQRRVEFTFTARIAAELHLAVLHDVTNQRAAELALRRSEERLRTVIANAPIALFAVDKRGAFTFCAGRARERAGLDADTMIGHSVFDPGGADTVTQEQVRRALSGEGAQWRRSAGELVFESTMLPLRDEAGGIDGAIGVSIDVTERERAESALRDSEARFRAMIEKSAEGISLLDERGALAYVSPGGAEMLGFDAGELLGRDGLAWVHEDDRARASAALARLSEGKRTVSLEVRARRRDGSVRWIDLTGTDLLSDPAVRAVVLNSRDITERKRAEESRRLVESERERLAAIVESSGEAIYGADTELVVRSWNRGAEVLYGYTSAEILGKPLSLLVPEDQRSALDEALALVARTGTLGAFEATGRRKNGSLVEVLLSASPLPVRAADDARFSIIARDLTERREAEAALHRYAEQLRQSQKMEAVGRLAGGVAHDFNNLLSVILSYAELMLESFAPGDPLAEDMEEIRHAGLRAVELTGQLLAFSRQQVLKPRVLDLDDVLGGMESMLRRILGEDITLTLARNPTLHRVTADPGQIEQIIMNLAVNARDAMPGGGRLALETRNVLLDEDFASEHLGTRAGAYAVISVTDTGEGMDALTRTRIFEPFFTTKEKGKGTGLGLATVFGIVQQSGGYVDVHSVVGRGTRFDVYLPCAEDGEEVVAPVVAAPSPAARASETVLLVEDETQVRVLARNVLRRAGYRVLEAENAGAALLLCEQHEEEIHLLLTDVVMPLVGGRRLAMRLQSLRPRMRVLYMSGYTDDDVLRHGIHDADVEFLAKPFTPTTLMQRVRAVLDADIPAEAEAEQA